MAFYGLQDTSIQPELFSHALIGTEATSWLYKKHQNISWLWKKEPVTLHIYVVWLMEALTKSDKNYCRTTKTIIKME